MDTESALVQRLRRGEMGALKEVYELHGKSVYRICLRLLGQASDAEDAAQEVFIRLFQRMETFNARARLSTWIHRMTVNLCLNRLEKERLRATRALPDGDAAPEDPSSFAVRALEQAEARLDLERMLERLTPEHRAVIVLREIEEMPYQEIAETLDVPVGTVMSRLFRARHQLAALWAPETTAIPP
jgi:RNA polymerase sigma-70 factor (ECF subfamily)